MRYHTGTCTIVRIYLTVPWLAQSLCANTMYAGNSYYDAQAIVHVIFLKCDYR